MKKRDTLTIEKHNSSRQIKIGAIASYITIAFNILSGLLYTPWMVRQIGQANYGLYTLAISIIAFFAMDFGLGSAVSRFLSKYKAQNDFEGEKKFLGITFKLFVYITVVLFIVLLVVYFFIESIYLELSVTEIAKLKALFVIAGLFTIVSFPFKPFDGILIANERFAFIKLLDLLHKVFTVALLVVALSLGYGLLAMVLVNAAIGLIKVILKYIYIKNKTYTSIEFHHKDKKIYYEIFKFSSWTTIILVAQRFILNITPTILGAFSGSNEIAVFSVGMTIEGYTWTIALGLGGLFLPKVTKLLHDNKDDMKEIEDVFIKVGRIQFLTVSLIIAGFVTMGYEFMNLWMGPSFQNSYYVAVLLVIPGIITLTQEIANTVLIAKNEIKYRAISSIGVAVLSVIFSMILAPKYGAIGAGVAIFIGNILGTIIFMNYVYYKVLRINIFRFFKNVHLKLFVPFVLTLISGFFIQKYLPVNNLYLFTLKAAVIAMIYIVLMWLTSMNKFEKGLIIGIIKNLVRGRKNV